MAKESKAKRPKTDWARLRNMKDDEIDLSDIPELTDEFWDNAEIDVLSKKVALSIRLDEDVVAWFKERGPGYQTRINSVLRKYIASQGPSPAQPQAVAHDSVAQLAPPGFSAMQRLVTASNSPPTQMMIALATMNRLADLYARQGKDSQAESLYKRALRIHVKALGARDAQLHALMHEMNEIAKDLP